MIRTQIQLTEEQSTRLKEISSRRGISVAELIRQSVDHFVSADVNATDSELRERTLSVIGKFHSDACDVSENHDDYLAEAYAEVAE